MAIGEIRLFAGNFAPERWALCDGRELQIAQYQDLHKELRTRYGGDGRSTFRLPDLRGRAPVHRADGSALGTVVKIPVDAAHSNEHGRVALNFIIATSDPEEYLRSEPFLGEVRPFAGNYAPSNFAECRGQLLPISQNTALFSILDKSFGGDGRSSFALPDLRGAYPVHPHDPEQRGKTGGAVAEEGGPEPSHRPLLAVTYLLAVRGIYPSRG
jgi:microcystin-dependent protein